MTDTPIRERETAMTLGLGISQYQDVFFSPDFTVRVV